MHFAPADFVADISLSYAGDMQLEVIAPVAGDSIYTEFLRDSGPGLRHICIEADDAADFTKALEEAEANGAAGVPYLEIALIPAEIRAFFDYVKREAT